MSCYVTNIPVSNTAFCCSQTFSVPYYTTVFFTLNLMQLTFKLYITNSVTLAPPYSYEKKIVSPGWLFTSAPVYIQASSFSASHKKRNSDSAER